MAVEPGKRKGEEVNNVTLTLKCASCNADVIIDHMTPSSGFSFERTVFLRPHSCPQELPLAESTEAKKEAE